MTTRTVSIAAAMASLQYVIDDALYGRTFAQFKLEACRGEQPLPKRYRLVGWIDQRTQMPCTVLVYSYLNAPITDSEADELARDYLDEIHALDQVLGEPDYIY